jgi:CRP-like cAMP-binding protein
MVSPNLRRSSDNKLLAALPRTHFDRLAPHLIPEALVQGLVLIEAGEEFDQVYFPHSGMLSLLVVMRNEEKAIETATVGREGVVGAMTGLGHAKSSVRVVVQLPTTVSTITASKFREIAKKSDAVRDMCLHFNEVLLLQARVTAACNVLHPAEARFCRWLLQSADRAEGDTVGLKQEFLAEMLGLRRTSVSDVAGKIQALGVITYSRGRIKIVDRPALERLSCECYETLLDH